MPKVTACPLVICPERLQFYSLSDHCQACAARVARKRERERERERCPTCGSADCRACRTCGEFPSNCDCTASARHARVITGTGDSGERRELRALIRGLRK